MIADPHAITQRQTAVEPPLVLAIHLQQMDLIVSERAAALLGITVEISEQRIRIRVTSIALTVREATVRGKVERARPVSARCFAVQQSLKVSSKLKGVIAASD